MFFVCSLVSACESEEAKPGVTAIYEGPERLDPFPSDHFLRDGRVALGERALENPMVRAYTTTAPELDRLEGFSTVGGIYARFTDELDVEELLTRAPDDFTKPGAPIALVDVDQGRALPIVVRYTTSNEDGRASSPDFMLLVEPAVPLAPRTRHVLVMSTALRAKSGAAVTPSPATTALLRADAEGAYGNALRATLPAVEKASGIRVDDVVLATMFTTGKVHDELATVAKLAREGATPVSSALTVERRGTDPGDERIRFRGTFPAPEHRGADGKWLVTNGKPDVQSTPELEHFLVFTKSARSGPRPLIVFGHGLGRDKDMCWELAQYLADLDVAILAIDAPDHGSRHDPPYAPGETDQVSSTLRFIGVDLDTRSIDVAKARDNFRQLASDQLHLFRLASGLGTLDVLPEGNPDGVPDIDPIRILYVGVSFGAVVGSTVLAFVPETRAAVLTVGGASLGTILRDSATLRLLVNNIFPADASDADFVRFITIAQSIVDPGDPVNYAPFVSLRPFEGLPGWRGADVLLQEAIDDSIIPNSATEMLARALGVVQVEPAITPVPGLVRAPPPLRASNDAPVRGLLQLDRADGQQTNHRTFFGTTEARKQYVSFIRSALADPRATIE